MNNFTKIFLGGIIEVERMADSSQGLKNLAFPSPNISMKKVGS